MSTRLTLPGAGRALLLKTFPSVVELRTARTLLRAWRDADLPAWTAMNGDPEVRRYFPAVPTAAESLAEAARIRELLARRGWGLWALEVPGVLPFAGFVGLGVPAFEAPFMPAVEIGWRLPREAWGRGFASEAAAACVAFAFEQLELPELVSFTVTANEASRRVMQRLGMQHEPSEDFVHPRIAAGHALARHVLYRLIPDGWRLRCTMPAR